VTAAAAAVKIALAAPAGTSTEAGTVNAEVKLLARETVVPPVGAVAEMVTLQVVFAEAARLVLPHCRAETVIAGPAVIEIVAEALEPPIEAVTFALWLELTAAAVAVKVAVVAAAGTSTEAGTVKAETRLLPRVTVVPPVGAALETVTVQVVVAEAARVALPQFREETEIAAGAVIEKAAEAVEEPIEAVTFAL
jgi:hypothetical protein